MKMIINDLMQFSDLDDDLKSPSLADRVENTGLIIVNFTIPKEYSTFNIFPGILSQPISYGASLISGILSQPMSVGPLEVDGAGHSPLFQREEGQGAGHPPHPLRPVEEPH